MKGRDRIFKAGALHHIYQRTVGGFLIFYSVRDFLVFFTRFCTLARKYEISVLGLCLMYDHIHVLIKALTKADMSSFVRDYTSHFSRDRNIQYQRKGQFFEHRFGSAPKQGAKKARTAIAYLYNNPVEKNLCHQADDYQWNFLKYAHNNHPFSTPLELKKASSPMRRAVSEINSLRAMDLPLSYKLIDRITKACSDSERHQLADYIITRYNCIDYQSLESFYDDFDKLLLAIHSNTGSEYQIKEVINSDSDKTYSRFTSIIKRMTGYTDIKDVLSLPEREKQRIAWILTSETNASPRQIFKYLQLPTNNDAE